MNGLCFLRCVPQHTHSYNIFNLSKHQNTIQLQLYLWVRWNQERRRGIHVAKVPASCNIFLCLFSRRSGSQKIERPTRMWGRLSWSRKSTSLRCGKRIKFPFRGFGFWLLITLSNDQNTKTKFTKFYVYGRAEIGKGPKSSPCCCGHILQIPSFCFPLAERNIQSSSKDMHVCLAKLIK